MNIPLQRVPSFFGDETKGIGSYYQSKIEELEVSIRERGENLERLRAQRNNLNAQGFFCLPFSMALFAAS